MQLKRLEIIGFKSFAKKSELLFTSPVTAVVGPNGSGKSNVVESIRFVLGEQSMKSLRGKLGADLIFKGSKTLPKQSRAGVTIVFDNTKRVFSMPTSAGGDATKLDFDEVSISREVYPDGVNRYLINGSEVRLKDVLELLASVNIGASGHHIISQGEADRILNASAKDRRAMIEDALGLKVYQYRIRESERKLGKTEENIKEAESARREILPHLTFLKKQVEKYEKAESMRQELRGLYTEYLKKEELYISDERQKIETEKAELLAKLDTIRASVEEQTEIVRERSASERALAETEEKARAIGALKDEVSRKLGRIEGMIELEEKRARRKEEMPTENRMIRSAEVDALLASVASAIDELSSKADIEEIRGIAVRIRTMIATFVDKKAQPETVTDAGNAAELLAMRETHAGLLGEVEKLVLEETALREKSDSLKVAIVEEKALERQADQVRFERILARKEVENALALTEAKEDSNKRLYDQLIEEIQEGEGFIGREILAYKEFSIPHADITESRQMQEDRKRAIERIKIKLEDIGAGGGDDIIKEYTEVKERSEFLAKEIDDLKQSLASLESLIRDLKEHLDAEFRQGLERINTQFENFFALMFGGGQASLAVVLPKKRVVDDEEITEMPEEEEFESGIAIHISLPHKKVKELTMLSGGERSLTSIALLFAISQVNPPPFLVLDETDAALDEANSRKYGDMLENLSKYSQLIVITHNRETMSRANVLYGVTVGADGASKLLSIKFDEAATIAK
ncbi:MAG: AAA family ATPase [Candidatus Pacebacteria bacterium]|jgi:chromosome segregation protein|nr:AAA family ATPase [Candidatus Paceibacterota bacterium]